MKKVNFLVILLIIVLIVVNINSRLNIQNSIRTVEVINDKEEVLFVGDSITDGYDLKKYYNYENKIIINSGVGGYRTINIINRFRNLVDQYNPNKLFLMIGTNDIGAGMSKDEIVNNIKKIIFMIREKDPNIKIYLETIYPINKDKRKEDKRRNNKFISEINKELKKYCESNDVEFIDIYSYLVDENDTLKSEYTEDGLHLNDLGYEMVTSILKPYVER